MPVRKCFYIWFNCKYCRATHLLISIYKNSAVLHKSGTLFFIYFYFPCAICVSTTQLWVCDIIYLNLVNLLFISTCTVSKTDIETPLDQPSSEPNLGESVRRSVYCLLTVDRDFPDIKFQNIPLQRSPFLPNLISIRA